MKFRIKKELGNGRGRVGEVETAHGNIETPAFIVVGTKATVKSLTPEQVSSLGAQAVLANTYHLYLQPGDELVHQAGGLHKMMNWNGPTYTDSGGFQAFSLGADFDNKVGKVVPRHSEEQENKKGEKGRKVLMDGNDQDLAGNLAKITEDGVTFKSVIDGSSHHFTPEKSIEIQHSIGADMIFAFDECRSPTASYEYQKEAMERTHRWAQRSLDYHKANNGKKTGYEQALLGIVQGGRHEDLRKESARIIGGMDFDGFGIG